MKKYLLYVCSLCLSMCMATSCSDEELTDTKITYYTVFSMNGDEVMSVPIGGQFTDPGCTATENGEDVTAKIVKTITNVAGEEVTAITTGSAGMFTISYAAKNVDGFSKSVKRTVFVYNPNITESIAGTYITDMAASTYGTAGDTFAKRAAQYGNTTQCTGITFTEVAKGMYYANDLLGGWYAQIRAYGKSYCMTGYVALNEDNTIELLSSYIAGWGDGLDYIENAKWDPVNKKISYNLSYASQIFMAPVLIQK